MEGDDEFIQILKEYDDTEEIGRAVKDEKEIKERNKVRT